MPTKKTTKRNVAKPATKKTVINASAHEAHTCACAHDCPCHHCGKLKKLVVLIIIFCLGFAAAKFTSCPCKRHHMKHMPKIHPVFVNNCLDMESIKCPKMQEELQKADVNGDGCISAEEFHAVKKSMMKQFHHEKPAEAPVEQPTPENM